MNGSRAPLILGALVLFAVSVLLVVAGTGYAVWQGSRQSQALSRQEQAISRQAQELAGEIRGLCAEHHDIGTLPLTPQSSEVGVGLVTDFRNAYAGLGCAPRLPAPSPLLRKLARQYGIPVRH